MPDSEKAFQLREWTVLPARLVMVGPDGEKHLEPKAMEMLVYLASRAGETVTRESLINEVWKGSYGGDEVLSRIISILRNQLGDNSRNPVFIETIPKIGYRLIVHPAPLGDQPRQTDSRFARAGLIGMVAVVVFVLMAYLFTQRRPVESPSSAGYVLAVLPFRDISDSADNQFFSVGLTDEIILNLNRSPILRIVARRSLDGSQPNAALGSVDYYIEGTVRFSDDQVRVYAELISANDNIVVWSESYESRTNDYLEIQRNLSSSIVAAINLELDLNIVVQPRQEVDQLAYTHYLNGLFLSKLRGSEPLRASINDFLAALAIEPSFDSARLGLANSYALLPYYSDQNEDAALTLASEQLGMLQQPDSAEANAIRGFIAFRQWRWLEADRFFRESIANQANIANTRVWYSQFLSAVGRLEEALAQAQLAYELDPLSPVVNDRLAVGQLWLDRDEEAARFFATSASFGFVNNINPGFLILLVRNRATEELQQSLRALHPGGALEPLIAGISALYDPARKQELATFSADLIQQDALLSRLEFGWWIVLGEWERVVDTVAKYASVKKNIDVEFLFSREAQGLRESPSFERVSSLLGLDGYWQLVGSPYQLTADSL